MSRKMKTLHLAIIVISISGLLAGISNQVFAPCLIGVTSCGPPPGVTVVATTDSQFYEKNDTITIQGQIYLENYAKPVTIQVVNPNNTTIQSIDVPVDNETFGTKIAANFTKTGMYQIVTCVQNWCNRSYIKFISEPYRLTAGSTDFLIKYKSFADLVGMEADVNNQALRIHISNATAQGLQFVIELPRALIDSKGYDNKDASFRVWIGMHQPDKYMQPVNFTEIASNDQSRTLAIDIPYDPVPNSSGTWDFKIMPADVASGPGISVEPPLKQFKVGISLDGISCKNGLYLAISNEKKPFCLKPGTISTLASRGLLYGTTESTGATILIAPGSENPSSPNGYSPKNVTVVIGVNNTVTWISQSDTPNTIVSDMPVTQNGETFGSPGVIKPNGRYQFTFTEPGTYGYHTEPHPWMKGTVIVVNPNKTGQILPASFEPCDISYPQSNSGIAVLYMPVNSTGKICVKYSNSNPPQQTGIRIFEAHHIMEDTKDVTSYATPNVISTGNSTIVYTITTGNHVGFYGLTIFCVGLPFAVGYDSNSNFVGSDFPWLGGTYYCPAQLYDYHIVGLSGIGVKYILYP